MGLFEEITQEIAEAFSTDLLDAVNAVTYDVMSNNFDVYTGSNIKVRTSFVSKGVISAFKTDEISFSGGSIVGDDKKVLILHDDLDVPMPKIGDEINLGQIINVKTDPANVAWVFQVRKPGNLSDMIAWGHSFDFSDGKNSFYYPIIF